MRSSQRVYTYLLTILFLLFHAATVAAVDSDDPNSLEALAEAGGKYVGVEACLQCHESQHKQIIRESHGQSADARTPFAMNGCESCHGPGEKHIINYIAAGDKDPATVESALVAFSGAKASPVEAQNTMCLQCHQGGSMLNWHDSLHEIEEVPCSACHNSHKPSKVMDRETEAEVCYECHNDIRAQTYQRSTHAIREGKVVCSDCHNSHGSNGPAMLTQLSINDNCYECHAEKRGPYLWEHYPVTEDCSLCHRSHGSMHNFLLNKQGTNLCQQCHAQIGPDGTGHIRTFYDAWDKDAKRGRSFLGRNCANCHKVHGSNHPSGPNLLR
ncbi:MAG: DmsE family decaheme c-type cytochrome [Gammaproteobacteria bacterium]|nr:DmsE family decaheme c-type cytochrome [Gammaproteobacteria bacterium]